MSRHILVIEPDVEYNNAFPSYPEERRYSIKCPDGNGCFGWVECREPHENDPHNYGPWACELVCTYGIVVVHTPFCEEEEFEFHNVVHTWRDGHNWTVPFQGCIVAWSDWEVPDGARELPYGEYKIEDEWDDEFCFLTLTSEEPIK